MPFAVAGRLIPEKFMCLALIVIMANGGLCPVVTEIVQNVRTMKAANGLTGNRPNCYRFTILWQHLHCLTNYDH